MEGHLGVSMDSEGCVVASVKGVFIWLWYINLGDAGTVLDVHTGIEDVDIVFKMPYAC